MTANQDPEDFLKEVADVAPLKQDKIAIPKGSAGSLNASYRQRVAQSFGVKKQNFLTDGEVEPVDPEEILSYKLSGIQPGVFKNLRLGKYNIDYHLDLHRKTVAEAREEVYQLLRKSQQFNYRMLLITSGKGIQSNPPARLKSYVNQWLKQVDIVLAFHSAQPKHGGTGSTYVLLKKSADTNKINRAKYD